jgi:hypothetical protein
MKAVELMGGIMAEEPASQPGFWSRFLAKQLIIVFVIFVVIILITEAIGVLTNL